MKFGIPVTITVTGWVEVEADSKGQASILAATMQSNGLDTDALIDIEMTTECVVEEIFEVN